MRRPWDGNPLCTPSHQCFSISAGFGTDPHLRWLQIGVPISSKVYSGVFGHQLARFRPSVVRLGKGCWFSFIFGLDFSGWISELLEFVCCYVWVDFQVFFEVRQVWALLGLFRTQLKYVRAILIVKGCC